MKHAIKEYEFDCKARKLGVNTIQGYMRMLRYLMDYLDKEYDITQIEDVKPFQIKHFLLLKQEEGTLCRLRKDYPDYKVVVREIAKKEGKKNTHKNLTYKAMGAYIDTTIADDEAKKKALAEFENVNVLGKARPVEPTCMFATGS